MRSARSARSICGYLFLKVPSLSREFDAERAFPPKRILRGQRTSIYKSMCVCVFTSRSCVCVWNFAPCVCVAKQCVSRARVAGRVLASSPYTIGTVVIAIITRASAPRGLGNINWSNMRIHPTGFASLRSACLRVMREPLDGDKSEHSRLCCTARL
jgi:hypothetical protein